MNFFHHFWKVRLTIKLHLQPNLSAKNGPLDGDLPTHSSFLFYIEVENLSIICGYQPNTQLN